MLYSKHDPEPTLDSMIASQRRLMLLCGAVLLFGILFAAAGGCQEKPADDGQQSDAGAQEDEGNAEGDTQTPDEGDAQQSPDDGDGKEEGEAESTTFTGERPYELDFTADVEAEAAALAQPDSQRTHPEGLRDQEVARATEAVSIIAYPWYEQRLQLAREGKWLSEQKAWLPTLVPWIGKDLCDHNRALEASDHREAERMLPRTRGFIEGTTLEQIGYGGMCKHLVLVEFLEAGEGWRVHGYSYQEPGSPELPKAIERAWPQENATAALIDDIAQMTETLTSYRLTTAGVFTRNDQQGKRFAEMEWAMDQGDDETATRYFREIMAHEPAFNYARYRRLQPWLRISHPDYQQVFDQSIELLTTYQKSGGTNERLLSLLVNAIRSSDPAQDQHAYAIRVANELIERDRLNMSAYTARIRLQMQSTGNSMTALRRAVLEYSEDGRYHALLGQNLAFKEDTINEALDYHEAAQSMRPWHYLELTQHGISQVSRANFLIGKSGITEIELDQAYEQGLMTLQESWLRHPNRVEFVMDYMVQAFTKGGRTIEHLSDLERKYVYAFTFISNVITGSQRSADVLRLFNDGGWRAATESEFVDQARKAELSDPAAEIPLLMACTIRMRDMLAASDLDSQVRLVGVMHATLQKYREFGGRNRRIEELWSSTFYDVSHAKRLLRMAHEAQRRMEEGGGSDETPPLRDGSGVEEDE